MSISLNEATAIAQLALGHARGEGLKPIAVIVLDAAGEVKLNVREDGASPASGRVAEAKAATAQAFRLSTSLLGKVFSKLPLNAAGLANALPGAFTAIAGGVAIFDDGGAFIGAAGVSGDDAEKDENCVIAAIVQAGFALKSEGANAPEPWRLATNLD
jgi:uncharacterized protein GlcG (DUF336 family)